MAPTTTSAFAWFEAVARAALAGTPLAADGAAFDAAFAAVWELFASAEAYEQFEDGRRLLAWARSELPGLQVCAISNVHEVYRDAVLPRLGLAEYLDFGLYSRVEGVAKPDRHLFDRAAARAGVDPSEVLHVGDHPIKDAAERATPAAVPCCSTAPALAPPDGVESISSLDDVRRWLEASSPNASAPETGEHALAESHEDEREFSAWLAESLRDAPGRSAYPAVFDSIEAIIVRWRRRFHGNPRLWKRLMKARLLKEIVEIAPVIAATQDFVAGRRPGDAPLTIVDLASGKGFLAMFLSEMLPPERVERIFLVDRAWPLNTNAARADRATADGVRPRCSSRSRSIQNTCTGRTSIPKQGGSCATPTSGRSLSSRASRTSNAKARCAACAACCLSARKGPSCSSRSTCAASSRTARSTCSTTTRAASCSP